MANTLLEAFKVYRTVSPSDAALAYRHHAAYLESIGLDTAIKLAAKPTAFQPIVHVEVNLLDFRLPTWTRAL